jgi:hypothetical protein
MGKGREVEGKEKKGLMLGMPLKCVLIYARK